MDFKLAIAQEIINALNTIYGSAPLSREEISAALEIPPDTAMGDYAFPCFKLSKALRKSPMMISDALSAAIGADYLGKVESVKGYLNFFIDRATFAEKIVSTSGKARSAITSFLNSPQIISSAPRLRAVRSALCGSASCFPR